MNSLEPRRIVPISVVTLAAFSFLCVLELFVMVGGIEVRASTVKNVAPWLHGSFVKLVGEHPDTRPDWAAGQGAVEEDPVGEPSSGIVTVAGFTPDELSVKIETGTVIEPTVPQEEPATVVPVVAPTNKSAKPVDDDIPVG